MTDMSEAVTYRLSSIDQSIIRTYIRYCLCFPCGSDEAVVREQVANNLTASTKRAISYMPILAGKVHLVGDEDHRRRSVDSGFDESATDTKQQGRVEARVTLAEVNDFQPMIKYLSDDEFPHTYEELSKAKMPADVFIGDALTPLPDMAVKNGAPVFAVQANFIKGGVLVSLYLHHSVADLKGMAAVIRHMSISKETPPGIRHTLQSLNNDAIETCRLRDRLSGGRGAVANDQNKPPEWDFSERHSLAPSEGTSRVLSISLEMLDGTRDMINERFQAIHEEKDVHLSAFDCLATILWKAITRARWPPRSAVSGKSSRIWVPTDMAQRMDQKLPAQFYGNSCLFSSPKDKVDLAKLTTPFDIGSLFRTAHEIRKGIYAMSDAQARMKIAFINKEEDVRTLNHPNIDFSTDVFITNWANLPIEWKSSLGLGLGIPEFARKVSRGQSAYGCLLLPMKRSQGIWEVMVSLTEDAMERLVNDSGLQPFILNVA